MFCSFFFFFFVLLRLLAVLYVFVGGREGGAGERGFEGNVETVLCVELVLLLRGVKGTSTGLGKLLAISWRTNLT